MSSSPPPQLYVQKDLFLIADKHSSHSSKIPFNDDTILENHLKYEIWSCGEIMMDAWPQYQFTDFKIVFNLPYVWESPMLSNDLKDFHKKKKKN